MNKFGLFILLLYVMALLLRWYQNFFIVLEDMDLPRIIRNVYMRLVYIAVAFILMYGSIIGIWYIYGLWAGLIALIMRMIVGRISYMHYFNREVTELAEWHYKQMIKIKSNPNPTFEQKVKMDFLDKAHRNLLLQGEDITQWDEPYMMKLAYKRAQDEMLNRMSRVSRSQA